MKHTRIGVMALLSASLLAAACGGGGAYPQSRPASATALEPVAAHLSQQLPVATFSGDGNTCRNTGACALGAGGHSVLTGMFALNPGIAILRAKDAGSGVFWAGLVAVQPGKDPLDTESASAIQAIGPFDGAGWLQVDGGQYAVAITAYGGYQLTVEQPEQTVPMTAQRSFSGTGTQVTPFMALTAGQYTLTANSNLDTYVQLVDLNGDLVAADDGSAGPNYLRLGVSGPSSKTFTVVLDGLYMLAVQTTSTETKPVSWSIAIS